MRLLADPRIQLFCGDSLDVLGDFEDESVDALVTDPPAGIAFMGKSWDHDKGGRDHWIRWLSKILLECYRVMKPGAHALVWALPRTSHWTGIAIEDAGFIVRDVITHHFGSGFPKSLNVQQAINKAARGFPQGGADPTSPNHGKFKGGCTSDSPIGRGFGAGAGAFMQEFSSGRGDDKGVWEGWGTALKPASEHWILARKPFEGSLTMNVLTHGTGALNVDATRIKFTGAADKVSWKYRAAGKNASDLSWKNTSKIIIQNDASGRWPANLILSDEAPEELDRQSGQQKSGTAIQRNHPNEVRNQIFGARKKIPAEDMGYGDTGGASRFFYCPKPSRREREAGLEHFESKTVVETVNRKPDSAGVQNPRAGAGRGAGTPILKCSWCGMNLQGGRAATKCEDGDDHEPEIIGYGSRVKNHHPTVKSITLMRYLTKLITPPRGIVLDPFMGSGSTGCAAVLEGFEFRGVDLEAEYVAMARARIDYWQRKVR